MTWQKQNDMYGKVAKKTQLGNCSQTNKKMNSDQSEFGNYEHNNTNSASAKGAVNDY